MSREFQNGYQVVKQCLETLAWWKRSSYRHTVDDYTDATALIDDNTTTEDHNE